VAIVTGASKKAFGKIDVPRPASRSLLPPRAPTPAPAARFEKQVIGMTPVVPPGAWRSREFSQFLTP
jgi:hypothetical protein